MREFLFITLHVSRFNYIIKKEFFPRIMMNIRKRLRSHYIFDILTNGAIDTQKKEQKPSFSKKLGFYAL